jgi:hypothetical protein
VGRLRGLLVGCDAEGTVAGGEGLGAGVVAGGVPDIRVAGLKQQNANGDWRAELGHSFDYTRGSFANDCGAPAYFSTDPCDTLSADF